MIAAMGGFAMRLPIVLAVLVASSSALAEAPGPMNLHLEVPQDKGPQQVNALVREFPVGSSSGWHVHPGVEIAYLIAGEMTLERAGQPTRRLVPGDSFLVPRGLAHNGANIGKVPARLVITYVYDKAAPLRVPVPAPVP
jgi:quercetin dioxygenase-like cupin family protein